MCTILINAAVMCNMWNFHSQPLSDGIFRALSYLLPYLSYLLPLSSFLFYAIVTSPIYRTCSLNSRKCRVPCRCHSQQTLNLVFRVLSIPYTLALKATSITVVLNHHAVKYCEWCSFIFSLLFYMSFFY